MKWKDKLIKDLIFFLKEDEKWNKIVDSIIVQNKGSVHLAVFNEPFLSMIFDGSKTMESRFSINNVTPFSKVYDGDIIIIKKSGGDVMGVFQAEEVQYFSNLNSKKMSKLEGLHTKSIGWYRDPEFLNNKASAKYLTLMRINNLKRLKVIEITKNDRTAWTFIKKGLKNTLFEI